MAKPITKFSGNHYFLSNFYYCSVHYEGETYPSVENAFQASKTKDTALRRSFLTISPSEAKKLGRSLTLRPDWESVKLHIMEYLLLRKFENLVLQEKLLATKDAKLIESNTWGDTFWGMCNNRGHNHLGKLLMKVRKQFSGFDKPTPK